MRKNETAERPPLKKGRSKSGKEGEGAGMPWGVLELLPDECELPNTATKARKGCREPTPVEEVPVVHSSSATSLSSGSSNLSKNSKTSNGSSKCSFAPPKRTAGIGKGRVRIAIMRSRGDMPGAGA